MEITNFFKPICFTCISVLMLNSNAQATPAVEDSIMGLYIAYYNRAANEDGVNFWMDQAASNGNTSALLAISEGFSNHPQFTENYPASDTTSQFIAKIYKNMLNRVGDAGGIAYWVDKIDRGLPKTEFIVNYINAVLDYNENDPDGIASHKLVSNKVMVAKYFKDVLGSDSNGEPGSLAYTRSIEILSKITKDLSTVDAAKRQIESYSDNSSPSGPNKGDVIN